VRRLPGLAPTNPEPTLAERAWWMATKGNQWLLRRSTDLIPTLAQLVAREWFAPPTGALAQKESTPGQGRPVRGGWQRTRRRLGWWITCGGGR
jgi:hypothetical protein